MMVIRDNPLRLLDRDRLLHPQERIAAFVQRVAGRTYAGPERRVRERHRVPLPVVAVPVSEDGEPTGDAFRTYTRDVSTGGVGLLHTRPVVSSHLALEISTRDGSGTVLRALVHVLRCRRINNHLYDIGGEFVTRVSGPDEADA